MKRIICFLLVWTCTKSYGQSLKEVFINDKYNVPVVYAKAVLKNPPSTVYYVNEGRVLLPDSSAAYEVVLNFLDGKRETITISPGESFDEKNYTLQTAAAATRSAGSPKNYWVGAKVGYNLNGTDDADNFVGAVKAAINISSNSTESRQFAVIGNVGNFKFDQSEEENAKIQKLAQSTNGLHIGLGWTFQGNAANKFGALGNAAELTHVGRFYVLTYYRYNKYVNVGTAEEDVNLSQFKTALGFEYEYMKFKKGGALSFALEPSISFFDKNLYNKLFNEKKGSLLALDAGTTIPITGELGFHLNGTFSPKSKPLFLIGFIVATREEKE